MKSTDQREKKNEQDWKGTHGNVLPVLKCWFDLFDFVLQFTSKLSRMVDMSWLTSLRSRGDWTPEIDYFNMFQIIKLLY